MRAPTICLVAAVLLGCESTAPERIALIDITAPAAALASLGDTLRLTAVAKDASGSVLHGRTLAWASSAPGIATVDRATGLVTAVRNGTAIVTASAEGVTGSTTIDVAQIVATLALAATSQTLVSLGDSMQIAATPRDARGALIAGQSVTWTTSNGAVATVDTAGLVIAIGNGTTVVSAKAGSVTTSLPFTIAQAVATVVLAAAKQTLDALGDTLRFHATAKDARGNSIDGLAIAWSSSDHSVATIDGHGLATALANGTTSISGSAASVTGALPLTIAQKPTLVELESSAQELNALEDTARFVGAAKDARGNLILGQSVTWSSSDPAIASVSVTGLVTAKGNGTAGITVTAGAVSATRSILVAQRVASVDVSPATVRSWKGASVPLNARPLDANGYVVTPSTITWTTANAAIATIATTGVVSMVDVGSTTITASSQGKSSAVTVTVESTVDGVLSANTVLTKAGGPYHVTGNVLIPSAISVRLEPGATMLFEGPYYIKVEGTLAAIGTVDDSVRFTSGRASPAVGDWSRIWFTSKSVSAAVDGNGNYVSGSIISYAVISYGGAIHFDASSPYFANNHVHHVTGQPPRDWPNGAIWACNSTAVIRDNLIEDNAQTGIYVGGGGVRIQRNTIRRNTGAWGGGLFFANPNCEGFSGTGGNALVEDNRITGNSAAFGGAIALYSGSPVIRHNDIKDNVVTGALSSGGNAQGNGAAIATFSNSGPQVTYNNIEGNSSSATGQSAAIFIGDQFSGTLSNNNIVNPTTFEIYIKSTLTGSSVDAASNYWNVASAGALDARTWDFLDNFEIARVAYTPILSERVTAAGVRTGSSAAASPPRVSTANTALRRSAAP